MYRDFRKTAGSLGSHIKTKDVIDFYFQLYLPAFSIWSGNRSSGCAQDILLRVLSRAACCRFDLKFSCEEVSLPPATLCRGYLIKDHADLDIHRFGFIQSSIQDQLKGYKIEREPPLQNMVEDGAELSADISSDLSLLDKILHSLPKPNVSKFIASLKEASSNKSGSIDSSILSAIFKNHQSLLIELHMKRRLELS